jgi:hypothetical protein
LRGEGGNLNKLEKMNMTETKFRMELTCCESVILNEIEMGLSQKQIAQSYALALRSSWPTDWKKVNEAIIAKWSFKALNRIKEMAWKGTCFPKEQA